MGDKTGISWCDATFNPWIGCTKVSQGCKLCYAETQNKRYNWTAGWGSGAPRKRTSEANWRKPITWAKQAVKDGVMRRVFCASLADVFDPEVSDVWRYKLYFLMGICAEIGGLEWLVLTKRPENIAKMMRQDWLQNPPPWLRLGITAEDQENYNNRYCALRRTWKGKNFISYEPALGSLVIGDLPENNFYFDPVDHDSLDWVICGGESGAGCRPMDLRWARDVRDQCKAAGIPFFMKQLGGFPDKRHNPAEWPEDLRIQEFPE